MPTGARSTEWAAGLFEGEGCLSQGKNGYWTIYLKMTDPDVMWDFYEQVGCLGNLGGLRKSPHMSARHKPYMEWRTSKMDTIKELVDLFYPYMGARRKAKMNDFYGWYATNKAAH